MKYQIDRSQKTEVFGVTVYRIIALKDFADVKKGDVGGWVQSYYNLEQTGDCWVYDDAVVMNEGLVCQNAKATDNANIKGTVALNQSITVNQYALLESNKDWVNIENVDGEGNSLTAFKDRKQNIAFVYQGNSGGQTLFNKQLPYYCDTNTPTFALIKKNGERTQKTPRFSLNITAH